MAADIESLIRQALARQNGFDPQVRSKIYQSSRNALAKMIANRGMVPPDVIESRNRSLEATIEKIEQEFTSAVANETTPRALAPQPVVTADPVAAPEEPSPVSIPQTLERPDTKGATHNHGRDHTGFVNEAANVSASVAKPTGEIAPEPYSPQGRQPESFEYSAEPMPAQPDFQAEPVDPNLYADPTPKIARPRPKPVTYMVWIIGIALILLTGWIAYMITMEFLSVATSNPNPDHVSTDAATEKSGKFVTILDPDQPEALVTAGNGTAEILSDVTQPAIRIISVRKTSALATQAGPMLLELPPGVLENIAGKKVTIEILAKSGDASAAVFTVACNFGDLGECGRKRFRIGLQPEAVIFPIQISANYKNGQKASLAINTDVTKAAAQSGKGAAIDIIYARIRGD